MLLSKKKILNQLISILALFSITLFHQKITYQIVNHTPNHGIINKCKLNSCLSIFENNNDSIKWFELIYENEIEAPVFSEKDWSYPWYVIKKNDGEFEHTYGRDITSIDTIKEFFTSNCFVDKEIINIAKLDSVSHLKFSKSYSLSDTLVVELFDKSASKFESLKIKIVNGMYSIEFHKSKPVYGYIYSYTPLESKLAINHKVIDKEMIGRIDLKLEQNSLTKRNLLSRRRTYLNISGNFRVNLEKSE